MKICFFLLSLRLVALMAFAQPADQGRTSIIIEALRRLPLDQIRANPKLQAALGQVLEASRGSPQFVELVRQFQITDQDAALLEFAVQNSTNTAGVDATRLILENRDFNLLNASLTGTNLAAAIKLTEALGNVAAHEIVSLLEPIVADSHRDVRLRKQAVRSLAKVQEGASLLLKLARSGNLPADLKFLVSAELQNTRWPNIKSEATELFPVPHASNSQALPPVSDLLKMKGSSKNGEQIFAREDVGCIRCHQVNGRGIDFGPNLSEIGTKLGKDALYEAILDPSAGISFGYETYQIELKNGDEVFGLLVSETVDEIAVKAQTGIVSRYKKSEITKREQQKISVMPAELQQTMSAQDLVDLIEYLSSLRKVSG